MYIRAYMCLKSKILYLYIAKISIFVVHQDGKLTNVLVYSSYF